MLSASVDLSRASSLLTIGVPSAGNFGSGRQGGVSFSSILNAGDREVSLPDINAAVSGSVLPEKNEIAGQVLSDSRDIRDEADEAANQRPDFYDLSAENDDLSQKLYDAELSDADYELFDPLSQEGERLDVEDLSSDLLLCHSESHGVPDLTAACPEVRKLFYKDFCSASWNAADSGDLPEGVSITGAGVIQDFQKAGDYAYQPEESGVFRGQDVLGDSGFRNYVPSGNYGNDAEILSRNNGSVMPYGTPGDGREGFFAVTAAVPENLAYSTERDYSRIAVSDEAGFGESAGIMTEVSDSSVLPEAGSSIDSDNDNTGFFTASDSMPAGNAASLEMDSSVSQEYMSGEIPRNNELSAESFTGVHNSEESRSGTAQSYSAPENIRESSDSAAGIRGTVFPEVKAPVTEDTFLAENAGSGNIPGRIRGAAYEESATAEKPAVSAKDSGSLSRITGLESLRVKTVPVSGMPSSVSGEGDSAMAALSLLQVQKNVSTRIVSRSAVFSGASESDRSAGSGFGASSGEESGEDLLLTSEIIAAGEDSSDGAFGEPGGNSHESPFGRPEPAMVIPGTDRSAGAFSESRFESFLGRGLFGTASGTVNTGTAEAVSLFEGSPRENAEAIREQVMRMAARNLKKVEIALTPERLGHLKIEVDMAEAGKARVRFVVASTEARDLISQSMDKLRDSLAEAGINLEGHAVDQDSGGESRGRERAEREWENSLRRLARSGRQGEWQEIFSGVRDGISEESGIMKFW